MKEQEMETLKKNKHEFLHHITYISIITQIQRKRNANLQGLFHNKAGILFILVTAFIFNTLISRSISSRQIDIHPVHTNETSKNHYIQNPLNNSTKNSNTSPKKKSTKKPISKIVDLNSVSNPAKFQITFYSTFNESKIQNFSIVFFSDIVKITYRHHDFNFTQINENSIEISLVIPITSYYNVSFCWKNKIFKTLYHNITDVSIVPNNVSSLECFGRYDHRWCHAKRICWQTKRFIFFGLPEAKINRTSMIPGSRPIPHDYPKCRVVVQYKMFDSQYPLPNNILTHRIKHRSFLTCRWYSMEYLWHALFDYTLPLYWTTKLNGGSNRTEDRIFTIDENTSKKGYQFLGPFTNHSIENIKVNKTFYNNTCFDDAIIGFPKSEYNVDYTKWTDNPLLLPYEYPIEAYLGFREKMMSFYSAPNTTEKQFKQFMDEKCEPDPKHPRIVIAFRNSTMRDIVNQDELTEFIRYICPNCIVDPYVYGGESFGEQMLRYCNASILLSIHGSQLSHMVWMKIGDMTKPTAVIEIKPYKYDCRDWYEQIANGAGIKYYQWINPIRNNTRTGRSERPGFSRSQYETCASGKSSCLACHDYLRDQMTTVDLKLFEPVIKKAIHYVMRQR